MTTERAATPAEDSKASLERAFINEYLRSQGHDPADVSRLPADLALDLRRRASLYAATKLAEVDARAAYVHEIHGSLER